MYVLIEWLNACMRGGLISRTQQEVILLLAAGWTDEAVGNKLDISSRTVQRHVSRTMTLVGARSRLELGILLSSRAQSWVMRRARSNRQCFALEPATG
ncbi:LuxR family transcriptional regulator [Nonomuraea deserti]|uniref:LuxR family transcriptional regulator n=1 Tax=Nonomuraea deserti TaxID=1848322 RepID=A0A4R4VF22_9ACTN|nr:helix-turn-helix transcriptional regulator [Nonomuraea deserti]TDD03461.1 LuxR family transcriptional regulator [Nonomuraea deserti]